MPTEREVTIHHVEMLSRSQLVPSARPHPAFQLIRAELPCPEWNRFLYVTVGGPWNWTDRLVWTLDRWRAFVDRPELQTWVAYVRGTPAGYVEMEHQPDRNIEFVSFGLLPQFHGQGLGAAVLVQAVEHAWDTGPKRVWLHTCSLDHPGALQNYLARGFREFKQTTARQLIPDAATPRSRNP